MFGRFYYSVKYLCPGGQLLNNESSDFVRAIEERKDRFRSYNYGGSWRALKERLSDMDADQLTFVKNIKEKYIDLTKIRIEEPTVTFYTETESLLLEIARELNNFKKGIIAVSLVTEEEKEILDKNCIIRKVDIGYKYKVVLKDGNVRNKESIYLYLKNLGDNVKISNAVLNSLSNGYPWTWGCWFYTNDADIASMLSIIEPGIVSNIHEVVVA